MSLKISEKFLAPINERNEQLSTMNNAEKIKYIKNSLGLHHGNNKKKKHKKKKNKK